MNMQTKNTTKRKPFLKSAFRELAGNRYLYLMMIPVVLYYLIFCYLPMYGIIIAFKDYTISGGIFGSEWVGLKHFKDFFTGIYFQRILGNTLKISLYSLLVGFPLPIIFALLMNELRSNKFKRSVQTVTYLPHFISTVVVCGMIVDFFSRDGIVTKALAAFGLPQVNYVGNNSSFIHVYVWTTVWQAIGWNSIVYLAALTGIDTQLYEAATIDGAGRFKQVLHVTIPGISSTIIVMLIMKLGQVMTVGYEKIILLYGPSTYESADVISSFVYRYGLGEAMQYSYSTAVNLFQSIINLTLLTTANAFSRKFSGSSLY